jgi:hypothetical protein
MTHNLIKLAEKLDEKKKYHESDTITEYLLDLVRSKSLKHSSLKTDIPTKLLMLEKVGVDTSKYYNALIDEDLSDEDLAEIDQKFETNCSQLKFKKKDTDLHEYCIWMKKSKEEPIEEKNQDSEEYLNDLRSGFIEFLTDIVVKDFKKEDEQMTPQNLIDFYFQNREKYEEHLDNYDLMLGQTEGIISDDNFVDELSEDFQYDEDMVRRAK